MTEPSFVLALCRFHYNTSSIHSKMICSSRIIDFTFNFNNLLAKDVLRLTASKYTVRTEHLTKFKCKSMNLSISFFFFLFSDFVKIRLIRTTRRQSAWTLRWSGLRCWVFLSAYSCKSHTPLLYIQ